MALPILVSTEDQQRLPFDVKAQGAPKQAFSVDIHALQNNPRAISLGSECGSGHLSPLFGVAGYFSSGWPVAYLIAAVICGIGALVGSFTYVSFTDVSQSREVVKQPSMVTADRVAAQSHQDGVGRITGMIDCKWANRSSFAINHGKLFLGDKCELSSGLLEITYETGAKVILQGPVAYTIESGNGGFLEAGRLTGRVEVEAARGFVVRTPNATVVDLGTEFGVEVNRQGQTTTHVFRGTVRMDLTEHQGNASGAASQVLHENESATVQTPRDRSRQERTIVVGHTDVGRFVREMPKRITKELDLVDVIAGGNGFSRLRGRGINPTNGEIVVSRMDTDPIGDGKYHPVEAIPFVDGVFIPFGGNRAVQLDSAGHTFAEFGNANNLTANAVWAGGEIPSNPPKFIRTELAGVDYASAGHGLLFMHSNKGITFDLDAVRRANPNCGILRFHAIVGNTETSSDMGTAAFGDAWVFVDGQPRFKYRDVSRFLGAMPISVPINRTNRFLTLAATDGGHAILYNWIIFGDPRLELQTTESTDAMP